MNNLSFFGNRVSKTRNIRYRYVYNELVRDMRLNPESPSIFYPPPFTSNCIPGIPKFNCSLNTKPVINPSINPSTPIRLSNIINNGQYYSRIQYANASANNPFTVNYLGRTEGQPGGSGSPPTNKLM
jgi:hypothetical protein